MLAEYIQVRMFSSVFLVTLDTNTVRQVIGERDGKRVARVLEPSVLVNTILEQAREFAKERGVKRVVQ